MISLNAHAKINLSLDVLRKRDDGYHDLQMIMQTIHLHDTITITEIAEGIEIECKKPYVPNNSSNIAYKAADALISRYNLKSGIRIKIDKRIPVSAGLAGGSTDAAAVLKGINELFHLGIERDELMKIGKTIGADVPFCLMGGTVLAEGIGEILTPLTPLTNIPVVLIKPKIGVSTAWVYKNLNLTEVENRPGTDQLVDAIGKKDIRYVAKNMCNVLESVTVGKYPAIEQLKKSLMDSGAIGSMMSGSGPTVFGIFESRDKAKKAFHALKTNKYDIYLTHLYKV